MKKQNENEITINGEIYIKKSSVKENAKPTLAENYVIVRAEKAGVFAGELEEGKKFEDVGTEVVLNNCRWIWYWDGAASINQMAIDGVSKPENCKFPAEASKIKIFGVCQIIPCTEKAQKSIKGVPVWKR